MVITVEGLLLKFPSYVRNFKRNPYCTKRTVPFLLATAAAPASSNSKFGAGSLGDLTKPDFPILHQELNGKRLVYLDNDATSQKPTVVLKALQNYYEAFNSNVR